MSPVVVVGTALFSTLFCGLVVRWLLNRMTDKFEREAAEFREERLRIERSEYVRKVAR